MPTQFFCQATHTAARIARANHDALQFELREAFRILDGAMVGSLAAIRLLDVGADLARMQREPAVFAGADLGIDRHGRHRRGVRDSTRSAANESRQLSRATSKLPAAAMRSRRSRRGRSRPDAAATIQPQPAMSDPPGVIRTSKLLRVVPHDAAMQRELSEPCGIGNGRQVIAIVGEPITLDCRVRQQHAAVPRGGRREGEILERHRQSLAPRVQPVRQEFVLVDARASRAMRVKERRRLAGVSMEAFAQRESAPRVAAMRRASSMRSRVCSGSSAGSVT